MKRMALIMGLVFLAGCQTSSLLDLLPPGQRVWQTSAPKQKPVSVQEMLTKVRLQKDSKNPDLDQPQAVVCRPFLADFQSPDLKVPDLMQLERFLNLRSLYSWEQVQVMANRRQKHPDLLKAAVRLARYIDNDAFIVSISYADLPAAALRLSATCLEGGG